MYAEILQNSELLLDSLIDDTYNKKLQWNTENWGNGKKSTAIVTIQDTKKFLKFELFASGTSYFIRTHFYKGENFIDIIEFQTINSQKEKIRLIRLSQAIQTRQIE